MRSFLGGPLAESIVGGAKSLIGEANSFKESVLENLKVFIKEDTEIFVAQEELIEMDEKLMNLSSRVDSLESKYKSFFSPKG